jgi:hypothetical protein
MISRFPNSGQSPVTIIVSPDSLLDCCEKFQLTTNPVKCQLKQICWFNYYHLQVPISRNLDDYKNLDNFEMKYHASWRNQGQQIYWTEPSFSQSIADNSRYISDERQKN